MVGVLGSGEAVGAGFAGSVLWARGMLMWLGRLCWGVTPVRRWL